METELNITNIKGVGEKMANKILKELGGEENLKKVIENHEVDKLSEIEGISQRKAVEIINELLGTPNETFLKTDATTKLYNEILDKIMNYAHTNYAINKILLLTPIHNKELIEKNMDFVIESKEKLSELPIKKLDELLSQIKLPKTPKIDYDSSKAILVESEEDYTHFLDIGLNNYYPILTIEEISQIVEYETILYLYTDGDIPLDDEDNIILINKDAPLTDIIPEKTLNYFQYNLKIIENAYEIKKILGDETVLGECLDLIKSIPNTKQTEDIDLLEITNKLKVECDEKIQNSIKNMDISGEEVLTLLEKGVTGKFEVIIEEILQEARKKLVEETGIIFDPFIKEYPVQLDEQELDRIEKQVLNKNHITIFDEKVKIAKKLDNILLDVNREIKEVVEFDYQYALGCFAYYHDLNKPFIGDKFNLHNAIHLNLANKEEKIPNIQLIDYELGGQTNIALLTGANSGGKTTLLETISQISIMTHMGLPISAQEAEVKLVDEIYFFSKKRSMDAGAFESFLRTIVPVVSTDSKKIVLIDELESITELEAAVKIIASFIDMMNETETNGIIVTHMAADIMKYTNIRVDGIEAKGLDEDYNLIVDRTPKMNYLARSTPELILKMIYERSEGKTKDIYGKILDKF